MLPKVRFGSRRSPRAALRALRRLLRPSRRLAVSSTLFPIAVLVALSLAKGGPAEGQRAPAPGTTTPTAIATPSACETVGGGGINPYLTPYQQQLDERYCQYILDNQAAIRARRNAPVIVPTPLPPPPGAGPVMANLSSHAYSPFIPAGDGYLTAMGNENLQRHGRFWLTSEWRLETPTTLITIYAGAPGNNLDGSPSPDRDRSQVIVEVRAHNGEYALREPVTYTTYDAPQRAGRLTITGAVGRQVQLVALSGATFVFDVDTLAFIEP